VLKTEKRLKLVATNPGWQSNSYRSPLDFVTCILPLQIATLYKLCCNEKSCRMLKSLFLE